jgi:hypothetical protein
VATFAAVAVMPSSTVVQIATSVVEEFAFEVFEGVDEGGADDCCCASSVL